MNLPAFPSIGGKPPIFHKVVFELRYQYGMTYLDRCGRTVNAIMKQSPEWVLNVDHPNPQSAPLISMENSCIFNFNGVKLDFSLERPIGKEPLDAGTVEGFSKQVEELTSLVIDQLELNEFSRIGVRTWTLYGCKDKQDSDLWISNQKMVTVPSSFESAFRGKLDSASMSVVIAGEDRFFRVAINGVERQAQVNVDRSVLNLRPRDLSKNQKDFLKRKLETEAMLQKNPEYAVMIDVDAYRQTPSTIQPCDFVISSYCNIVDSLRKAMVAEHGV